MADAQPSPAGLVVAIFGPTATGKSAVAAALACRVAVDLISADSMQLYRGVPVLTNQPSEATALVAIWELSHVASLGEYQRLAHECIDSSLMAGRTPVVVGGTGLYLRAALAELDLPPDVAPQARRRWEALYARQGPAAAHAALAARDARAAAAVHPNDRKRVVRALELAEAGHSLRPRNSSLWSDATRHPSAVFGLELPADVLLSRIRLRARAMILRGALGEARRAAGANLSETARHVIGIDELNELSTEEAEKAIVERTRRYAAYQRKWMRRVPDLIALDARRQPDDLADEILEVARARQRLPGHRAR
ncbi:MAG: tRNA (adenosine(37)-N6)-dimethylallyltransferase [Gaiellales bacterium]